MNNRVFFIIIILMIIQGYFCIAHEIIANLPDGSIYKGEEKDGLFNGKGILIYKNGDFYEGLFKR